MCNNDNIQIPKDNIILYQVWEINCSDIKMFTIEKLQFDYLFLFVGETKMHWIYYNAEPVFRSAEGNTPITLNYCSCCFNKQYPLFIKSIQENLKENDYLLS